MTTALVPLEPSSLAEAEQFAKRLAESALMPSSLRGKPADVLVVMLTGRELGVSPLTALRSIHVVQGRPVLDAALIVALAKKSPVCKYFSLIESTDQRATYETLRVSEQPTRLTYTIEQAKTAGLTGKDNWKHHPAAMLRARASSALARAVYPDLVLNVMDEDEGAELAARDPAVFSAPRTTPAATRDEPTDAEWSEGPTEQQRIDGWQQLIEAAGTAEELRKSVGDLLGAEPAAVRDAVRDTYGAKMKTLRAQASEAAA